MYKLIFKTTLFYYALTFFIVYKSVDVGIPHFLREYYLSQYQNSPKPQERILLYNYLTYLEPQNDTYWFKLAGNFMVLGYYSNAISAYRKALSINPQVKSYQEALSYCYELERKNPSK
jgi:tetratricopeptide (TPR) repeat protein